MKKTLNKLIEHQLLEREEARQVLVEIARGSYNTSQIAAFLTVFMMRSIRTEELEGFRDALLELCQSVDLGGYEPIDLCGTGGDGKNTFNISTLASFVTAGAGIPVAKHGNYGVSSQCGSSNVLEFLGVRFSNDQDYLRRCMERAGICILHAPLFHPAMKNVAPIRRELGVKTFFNMLGPMVNPAFPKYQMVGVFNLELARMYGYLYQNTDKIYSILHGLDGYDEISLTGPAKVIRNKSESVLNPEDFGLQSLQAERIHGGESIEEAAGIFLKVLQGRGTPEQQGVVCANAAVAISTVEGSTLEAAFGKARESLESGRALQALRELQELSRQA
ncbi:anthranilate phosphoribosyltransferase [Robiginitalea sp. SC105]|uniref:anthranilate phosphoribosyltransferase n=1 Tax=Robiginitalea sp. SC105 TaxID=2762332 RepID=UPI001639CCD2|nr:anthranilate phosphoribosyltransferase [Robiginitalea sp. SC105]MBC2839117.1 anthranilate phosphoribosyltransferase [Robiginitalea sp. SC105]